MKSRFSIRTAILLPFLLVIIAMLVILSIMIRNSYESLALEQGTKLIASMNENAEEKLVNLLNDPSFTNALFADLVSRNAFYKTGDYRQFEELTKNFMSKAMADIPQITVIGIGDINKNYMGYRYNADKTYTLMVKDENTENMLNIYSGDSRDTEIVVALEAYDPTARPWYTPVVENPIRQWSDIYVNYDEIQDTTITSIAPVFNEVEEVVGVTGIDVSLNGINSFLRGITDESGGVVYLIEKDFGVIAHSTDELMVQVLDTDPPTTEFTRGMDSENPLIVDSSVYFSENFQIGQVKQLKSENTNFYTMISPVDESLGLDWYIVVAISEEDLIGNMASQFDWMRTFMVILGVVGLIIGSILISVFISSVTSMAKSVEAITPENLDVSVFDHVTLSFKEIEKLQKSYKNMMTELKDSFEHIVKSEKRYRTLIENSDALIFSMTKNGEVLSFNDKVLQYAKMTPEELRGSSFYDLFEEQALKEKWHDNIMTIIESMKPLDEIYDYYSSAGDRVVFKIKIFPMVVDGNVETLIATFVDIVELVEAQEELDKINEMEKEKLETLVKERTSALEQAMDELVQKEKLASLGSLVSGISHEINTPLGVAVSASSYLKSTALKKKSKLLDGTLTKNEFIKFVDNIEESVVIIENNLVRANELITSFKQISVNRSFNENNIFNMYEYIHATLISLKHELKVNNHEVVVDCDERLTIFGNAGSFSQIITNLVLNSLTHGYDDEQGHIKIKVEDLDDEYVITYHDDGKGIEEEIINRVFDPFFTTNRKRGGSGLGLNIVYNIISGEFEGHISVENDNGAKFVIRLPKRQEA